MTIRIALLAPLAALSLAGCGINSVPTAEENAKAKWANVQADYQRRADLIPNLVATVKGFAKQEKDVLIQVTQARASATQVQLAPGDLTDPAKVQAFQNAQNGLTLATRQLQEAYPELTSNRQFETLMSQLEGSENRVNVSRKEPPGPDQAQKIGLPAVSVMPFHDVRTMVFTASGIGSYSRSRASLSPFAKAQSKNFKATCDLAGSAGLAYIRMKVADTMGHASGAAWWLRLMPKPGAALQFAETAAAWNDLSSGAGKLPALFWTRA